MVVTTLTPGKTEKTKKLSELKPGDGLLVRFLSASFEQAVAQEGGHTFYLLVDVQPKKTGRVTLVSVDGKILMERDDDHRVVVHKAKVVVSPAEMVKE